MKILGSLILVLAACCGGVAQARIVTAAQANGTYRYRSNEIKILAIGNNRLRIQMDPAWEYKSPNGPANVGQAHGEAAIENDVAAFRPQGTEDCTVTIK